MASTSNEYQLQLVYQAFEKDPQLNIYEATQFYNIFYTILSNRINDCPIRIDIIVNLRKLTALKEEVIVREIFNLDSRRFPLWIYNIKDIANQLLTIYNIMYVGLH